MLYAVIADDEPAVGKLIRYFLKEEQVYGIWIFI